QLLRADALQLVELLRDGGARARRGGAAAGALSEEERLDPAVQAVVAEPAFVDVEPASQLPARVEPAGRVRAIGEGAIACARHGGDGYERKLGSAGFGHARLLWRGAQSLVGAARPPSRRSPERGPARCAPAGGRQRGMTLTATRIFWPRPPRMTPRSGTTSAKSPPVASVM